MSTLGRRKQCITDFCSDRWASGNKASWSSCSSSYWSCLLSQIVVVNELKGFVQRAGPYYTKIITIQIDFYGSIQRIVYVPLYPDKEYIYNVFNGDDTVVKLSTSNDTNEGIGVLDVEKNGGRNDLRMFVIAFRINCLDIEARV